MALLGHAVGQRLKRPFRMAGHLVVVSREHADLYVYLRDRFAREGYSEVEIILDRRLNERRRRSSAVSGERRRNDRRVRPDVDAQLRERSHVVVYDV